jgi:hypothetical protein
VPVAADSGDREVASDQIASFGLAIAVFLLKAQGAPLIAAANAAVEAAPGTLPFPLRTVAEKMIDCTRQIPSQAEWAFCPLDGIPKLQGLGVIAVL